MLEGKTLEFKRDLSSPKNMLKTLVAFANTAGGRLLIGIEDDSREVEGVEDPLDEEEQNLPEPRIEEIGMRVRFTVYLTESMATEVSRTSKEQVTEHVTEHVTEQVRPLLFCLKTQLLERRDAMVCIGLNSRQTFVFDYLKPAIQAGLVEMTLPDSPKSPTQKYRLKEPV